MILLVLLIISSNGMKEESKITKTKKNLGQMARSSIQDVKEKITKICQDGADEVLKRAKDLYEKQQIDQFSINDLDEEIEEITRKNKCKIAKLKEQMIMFDEFPTKHEEMKLKKFEASTGITRALYEKIVRQKNKERNMKKEKSEIENVHMEKEKEKEKKNEKTKDLLNERKKITNKMTQKESLKPVQNKAEKNLSQKPNIGKEKFTKKSQFPQKEVLVQINAYNVNPKADRAKNLTLGAIQDKEKNSDNKMKSKKDAEPELQNVDGSGNENSPEPSTKMLQNELLPKQSETTPDIPKVSKSAEETPIWVFVAAIGGPLLFASGVVFLYLYMRKSNSVTAAAENVDETKHAHQNSNVELSPNDNASDAEIMQEKLETSDKTFIKEIHHKIEAMSDHEGSLTPTALFGKAKFDKDNRRLLHKVSAFARDKSTSSEMDSEKFGDLIDDMEADVHSLYLGTYIRKFEDLLDEGDGVDPEKFEDHLESYIQKPKAPKSK